jgi:hypothetical protein
MSQSSVITSDTRTRDRAFALLGGNKCSFSRVHRDRPMVLTIERLIIVDRTVRYHSISTTKDVFTSFLLRTFLSSDKRKGWRQPRRRAPALDAQ